MLLSSPLFFFVFSIFLYFSFFISLVLFFLYFPLLFHHLILPCYFQKVILCSVSPTCFTVPIFINGWKTNHHSFQIRSYGNLSHLRFYQKDRKKMCKPLNQWIELLEKKLKILRLGKKGHTFWTKSQLLDFSGLPWLYCGNKELPINLKRVCFLLIFTTGLRRTHLHQVI